MSLSLAACRERLRSADLVRVNGCVTQVVGLVVESTGPRAAVGEVCEIHYHRNKPPVMAEVVGFRENRALLMPLGPMEGIGPGSVVVPTHGALAVPVGPGLLGRVIDSLGHPIDGRGPIEALHYRPVQSAPPNPLERRRIEEPLPTGIRAIDACLTCGRGQRFGVFAGSGVGKSILMGMVARKSAAQVNVIGLVGERGREVKDFIERDLRDEGLARSVVVAVTGDRPALLRVKGALLATAVAEYFRDQGMDVLLMIDSITRVAMAQREIGLTVGEPPTTRGYTPSVFALLPQFLERAGTNPRGSITGLYTVLVEGDDMNEPIADAARSILDGHIVLSRRLAARGHYPAIDVLDSVSRVMIDVTGPEHRAQAREIVDVLATYREAEDLVNIGAYVKGSNPRIDHALARIDPVNAFLRQDVDEDAPFEETLATLARVGGAS
jgi:flagellum-specific ATP synthase